MSSVQSFATWAAIAAKVDTFPKLPAGSVDVFLTKAEILAKGGDLIKIDGSYSDNSFVAIEHVSQYVVEWRYTFGMLKSTRTGGPSSSIYGISIKIWHHGTSPTSPVRFNLSNPS